MLVRQIKLADEVVEDNQPYVAPERICSPETAKKAQELLRGVVQRGTARHINSMHYAIAGKTGTAQKIVNGKYQVGKYYTSFIGYFPANKPRYSVLAVVDSPQGDNADLLYAGTVAAPVFREVADRIVAYDIQMHEPTRAGQRHGQPDPKLMAGYANDLHIISNQLNMNEVPSTEGWVEATSKGQWRSRETKPNRVPDVRGLSLRDALFVLENKGYRVLIEGKGRVKEQSMSPGQSIADVDSKTITLRLG
jgi:cell division protein FtsI (penicillin-binding protein 3)